MSMHDAFSGLFPSIINKGVAGVSGVAHAEIAKISKTSLATPSRNTSLVNRAAGVSSAPSATPDQIHGHGGGVAEKTEEIQRNFARETPATHETPSKQYTGLDFTNHAARFCAMPCPAIYSPQRWQQVQADAKQFSHLWGSQVAALGWKPDDVFAIPDGLIPLIEGGDILAVCEKTAVVRAPNRRQFNTIRFAALSGEPAPKWRVWASWCEP